MAPNTHNNIYYGPGRYSKHFNPFNPHENSVRYYYCPFCFPDAETEMKRLGNLLKVVASRWQLPGSTQVLWPLSSFPLSATLEVHNLLPTVKKLMVLQAAFNWQMSTTGSQRSKSGGIDLVLVVEEMDAQDLWQD